MPEKSRISIIFWNWRYLPIHKADPGTASEISRFLSKNILLSEESEDIPARYFFIFSNFYK